MEPAQEEAQNEDLFYKRAAQYWASVPPTIDGVLGGFGFISQTDIEGSVAFLTYIFALQNPPGRGRALDCGAGIGRITKDLLLRFFEKTDLIEQNPAFLDEARNLLGTSQKVGDYYCAGLQDFSTKPETYDVIWCQWVLGHLTDDDFVNFFKCCRESLKPNGIIVVKENITSSDEVEVDKEDSSVTRPLHIMKKLFKQAGLHCIKEQKQAKFPRGLYTVKMFALRPETKCEQDHGTHSELNGGAS